MAIRVITIDWDYNDFWFDDEGLLHLDREDISLDEQFLYVGGWPRIGTKMKDTLFKRIGEFTWKEEKESHEEI